MTVPVSMTSADISRPAGSLRVARDATPQAWDEFLASRGGSINHDRAWDDVLAAYGLRVFRLSAWDQQRLVGVLPLVWQSSRLFGRRLVSLPWFDAAGVLTQSNVAGEALLREAKLLAGQCGAHEVHLRQASPVEGWPTPRTDKVLLRLPLEPDPDRLWKQFGSKVRNQIRKAEKEGLTFESGGSELLSDFYRVYSANMRDLGSPSHSLAFLRAVLTAFPAAARVHLVRLGPRTVGAGMTLGSGRVLEIPWASSLRRYNSYCVNHWLYWNILQQACRDGRQMFHFGRSTIDSGTYHFKKQWGAEAVPLYWYTFPTDGRSAEAKYRPEESFSLGRRAWQWLPLWLASRLGPRIIRHVA